MPTDIVLPIGFILLSSFYYSDKLSFAASCRFDEWKDYSIKSVLFLPLFPVSAIFADLGDDLFFRDISIRDDLIIADNVVKSFVDVNDPVKDIVSVITNKQNDIAFLQFIRFCQFYR